MRLLWVGVTSPLSDDNTPPYAYAPLETLIDVDRAHFGSKWVKLEYDVSVSGW